MTSEGKSWLDRILGLTSTEAPPPLSDGPDVPKSKTITIGDLNRIATQSTSRSRTKKRTAPKTRPAIQITPEFQEAINAVRNGDPLIFVSGGAGTGKSTFIDLLCSEVKKHIAIVAPTGIAALNVSGETIHSFFKFPVGIFKDNPHPVKDRRLFEKLDILIIDEISMVRVDLLEHIDAFLRVNARCRDVAFGGVQIVFVGDLFQLPPVIASDDERQYLEAKYASAYFFSAACLSEGRLRYIELTKTFRQENATFAALLNNLRTGDEVEATLEILNRQCRNDNSEHDDAVILTPTNKIADDINHIRLDQICERERTYEATIKGNFKIKDKLPAPQRLVLRAGARVMFTKNGSEKKWVNGTIGTVVELFEDCILVRIGSGVGSKTLEVSRESWETYAHVYDEESGNIERVVVGEYTQFPLTLAWAITIHKSQGLSLDRVHLDLGRGAFAAGQVYVALSRARTLDGLSFARSIRPAEVQADSVVKKFYLALKSGESP